MQLLFFLIFWTVKDEKKTDKVILRNRFFNENMKGKGLWVL